MELLVASDSSELLARWGQYLLLFYGVIFPIAFVGVACMLFSALDKIGRLRETVTTLHTELEELTYHVAGPTRT